MSRRVHVIEERFALKAPFRISRAVKDSIEVVMVTIADSGHAGRGEGVPYPRYGESVADAVAAVEEQRSWLERGGDRNELLRRMPPGAARNAIDCALWDLECRAAGGGLQRPSQGAFRTALTVSLDAPAAMETAAAALPAGALIKVKVDRQAPVEQLRAVRRGAPAATLIVDPNESWDEVTTRALQPLLVELGVALLEQPVPAEDDEWLTGFEPEVPICADEAVHTAADLDTVAGRYQFVNVKLDKSGGLTSALALTQAVRARGLGLMVGCMVCTSLSIAPALTLLRGAAFADLDGPLWLRQDRIGGVRQVGAFLEPAEPGFWLGSPPPY